MPRSNDAEEQNETAARKHCLPSRDNVSFMISFVPRGLPYTFQFSTAVFSINNARASQLSVKKPWKGLLAAASFMRSKTEKLRVKTRSRNRPLGLWPAFPFLPRLVPLCLAAGSAAALWISISEAVGDQLCPETASDEEAAPGASNGVGSLVSLECMSVGLRVGNCVTRAAEKKQGRRIHLTALRVRGRAPAGQRSKNEMQLQLPRRRNAKTGGSAGVKPGEICEVACIKSNYLRRRTFRFPLLLHACDITRTACAWKGIGERSRAPQEATS